MEIYLNDTRLPLFLENLETWKSQRIQKLPRKSQKNANVRKIQGICVV